MATTKVKTRELARPYQAIGQIPDRKPQRHNALAGTRIISADNHICFGGEDFFYDNAPAPLKSRVPRITHAKEKGFWEFTLGGKSLYPYGADDLVRSMEGIDGAWNVDVRMLDLDAEGIAAEVAFPQTLPGLFAILKDFEVKSYVMSEYTKYMGRLQRRHPGRFYGVAVPNYWGTAEEMIASVKEIKQEGVKALMLPNQPGVHPDGQDVYWASDRMRPMWQAIADADLTVCFHIGEGIGSGGKGAFGANVLRSLAAIDFRPTWGKLVFGGVLDDFPELRVVFAEGNIHWIPGMLNDADMVPEAFPHLIDYKPKLRPSEYWYRNCAATFMHDPVGLRLIDVIGARNAMFSVDYPHNEGIFGYTGTILQTIVDTCGEEDAKLICGGNAAEWYRI